MCRLNRNGKAIAILSACLRDLQEYWTEHLDVVFKRRGRRISFAHQPLKGRSFSRVSSSMTSRLSAARQGKTAGRAQLSRWRATSSSKQPTAWQEWRDRTRPMPRGCHEEEGLARTVHVVADQVQDGPGRSILHTAPQGWTITTHAPPLRWEVRTLRPFQLMVGIAKWQWAVGSGATVGTPRTLAGAPRARWGIARPIAPCPRRARRTWEPKPPLSAGHTRAWHSAPHKGIHRTFKTQVLAPLVL